MNQPNGPDQKPLCVNCAHYRASTIDVSQDECGAEDLNALDLVRGTRRKTWCQDERMLGHRCGKEGKLFAPAKPF